MLAKVHCRTAEVLSQLPKRSYSRPTSDILRTIKITWATEKFQPFKSPHLTLEWLGNPYTKSAQPIQACIYYLATYTRKVAHGEGKVETVSEMTPKGICTNKFLKAFTISRRGNTDSKSKQGLLSTLLRSLGVGDLIKRLMPAVFYCLGYADGLVIFGCHL